jgi:TolB protein
MRRWSVILPVCLLASCSVPPPGSEELQITSGNGVARSPALSHDGSTVAFAARADWHANAQIWVRRVDGSAAPLRLTDDASQNYDPEFSPDGKSVYFTSTRAPQGIYGEPVSGGTPEPIVQNAVSGKISPDGKTVLYGIGGKLYQRPLQGGSAAPVLPAIDNSYAPVWARPTACAF